MVGKAEEEGNIHKHIYYTKRVPGICL